MLKFLSFLAVFALVNCQSGPGVPDSRCPPGTPDPPKHLPHESDCTKFYKCSNSLAVPFDCPPGQHWSVSADACDLPERANCQAVGGCPDVDPVWPKEPVHLPHPTDCTKFFKCSYGVAHEMNCPPGQHWAIKYNWCDFPDRAECDRGSGGGGETTTAGTTSKPNSKEKTPKPNSKEKSFNANSEFVWGMEEDVDF